MTKKKAPTPATSGGSDRRIAAIVLKGTPEYKRWLASISEDSLIPVASIVRDALAKWAKERGYPDPPKR